MKTSLARWTIAYGVFIIACGVAGYLSNPEKAKAALISGSAFGTLSMLWGRLMARGAAWSRWAAIVTSGLLVAMFAWRAGVSWLSVAAGANEKVVAAVLITPMGMASIGIVTMLLLGSPRRSWSGMGCVSLWAD